MGESILTKNMAKKEGGDTMNKKIYKIVIMIIAMLMACSCTKTANAAIKKNITMYVHTVKIIHISGTNSKKFKAYNLKNTKKSIINVSKRGKTAFKIIAKKAGKSTITIKVQTNKLKVFQYKIKVAADAASTSNPEATKKPSHTAKPAATKKPTVTAKPTVTTTPTVTATPGTIVDDGYTYSFKILNSSKYKLYTKEDVIFLVKTDRPEETRSCSCLDDSWKGKYNIRCECDGEIIGPAVYPQEEPDNIIYPTNGTDFIDRVSFDTPGIKKVDLCLYKNTGPFSRERIGTVASFQVTVYDGEAARDKWYKSVIAENTNNTMTEQEKIDALSKYMKSHIRYSLYTGDMKLNLNHVAHLDGKWVWLSDTTYEFQDNFSCDCWGASDILIEFAKRLGLSGKCVQTDPYNSWHLDPQITFSDGSTKTYFAQNSSDASGKVIDYDTYYEFPCSYDSEIDSFNINKKTTIQKINPYTAPDYSYDGNGIY